MRLLYLTNGFPYPLTSGYLRHYFLLKELSIRHEITLLSIVGRDFDESYAEALAPFTQRTLTFTSTSRGQSLGTKLVNHLRSFVGAERAVREMRSAVRELAKSTSFDAVFCGKRTQPAIAPLGDVPLIADMCDATSTKIRGSLRYADPGRLPVLLLEYAHMRHTERKMIREASHSVFVSCRDRDALVNGHKAPTTIMPNGVDLEFWRRSTRLREADTIVFTGAMNYRPNTDAALYLAREIFPAVRAAVPGAQLCIVGRDPTEPLVRAGRRPGVEVTGYVDDVRPFLERATVFVAPLRFGAGIQNKLLEAMAMEVPVVASPLAADGLRTENGQVPPLAVADGRDPFVDEIVKILTAHADDPNPDRKARSYVEEHFVWTRSAAMLDRIIHEVARAPS